MHKPVVVTTSATTTRRADDGVGVGTVEVEVEVEVEVAFFTLVVDECWVNKNGTLYLDGCTCGSNADPTADPPYQCYAANSTMPGLWYQFGINDALIASETALLSFFPSFLLSPKSSLLTSPVPSPPTSLFIFLLLCTHSLCF